MAAPIDNAPFLTRWWARWLALLGLWSLPGLVSSTQLYYIRQSYEPISVAKAIIWQMPIWYFWLPVTPLIYWLCQRFPIERGRLSTSIPVHVLTVLALSVPHMAVSVLTGRLTGSTLYLETPFLTMLHRMLARYIHLDLVTYGGVVAAANALAYYRRYRQGLLVAAQLETKLARAQLEALKMQLHPHFLFNTLHAVGVLVRKQDTKGALGMLIKLSELLRITLDSAGQQLVPLRQELDFLERYLRIEEIRFRDRLKVSMDIDPELLDALVPNLALQPLVENAIRHGIAPRAEPGTVYISAQKIGERMRIEICDDGVGLAEDSAEWTGMGLGNVRARLKQLYGSEHQFEISDRTGGGVRAVIELPLQTQTDISFIK